MIKVLKGKPPAITIQKEKGMNQKVKGSIELNTRLYSLFDLTNVTDEQFPIIITITEKKGGNDSTKSQNTS